MSCAVKNTSQAWRCDAPPRLPASCVARGVCALLYVSSCKNCVPQGCCSPLQFAHVQVSDSLVSEMLLRIAGYGVPQVEIAPNCRSSSTVDNVDHHVERSFTWEEVAMQRALCLPLQNVRTSLES